MTSGIEVSSVGDTQEVPRPGLSRLMSSRAVTLFRTSFLTTAFLRFLGVGVVNAFNGVWLAWTYSLFLQPNVAFVAGCITSVTISFFLNSWIVFKTTRTVRKYVKFVLSYVPNFLIQNVCVIVVYNILGFHELVAYTIAAAVGVPVTFLMIKFFAFGGKRTS